MVGKYLKPQEIPRVFNRMGESSSDAGDASEHAACFGAKMGGISSRRSPRSTSATWCRWSVKSEAFGSAAAKKSQMKVGHPAGRLGRRDFRFPKDDPGSAESVPVLEEPSICPEEEARSPSINKTRPGNWPYP